MEDPAANPMRDRNGHGNESPRGSKVTERTLVYRAQDGDSVALKTLFEGQLSPLRRRVHGRLAPAVRRKVSESDVIQEACMVATRRIEDFEYRGEGSFARWLAQIADNVALTFVRRHAQTAKRDAQAEVSRDMRAETGQYAGQEPSPSAHVMASELRERMEQAIRNLPEDYRVVLELLQHRRFTLPEAAQVMGRSVNAIKKLHARALGELADRLGVRGRGRDGSQ